MIDTWFDTLARTLAGGVSRRTGLRLLAGAGVALLPLSRKRSPGASAQSGINQTGWGFDPGDSCVTNYQCDNSYPELGLVVCDDTGYVYGQYGGELHCCRYAGGSCGGPLSDAHNLCCGDLLCLGGTCGRA